MRQHGVHARWHTGALLGALMALMVAGPAPVLAQQPPADFTAIVKQKTPAVVAIATRQMVEEQQQAQAGSDDNPMGDALRRFFEERQGRRQAVPRQALGSGFIISPDGYVVTNNHVVENAAEIHVIFDDKTNVAARIVGRDPATDLAILKVDGRTNLPTVAWGNSDEMEPGAWVIAIGSPFGLGGTVTVGVLSARSRDIRVGPFDDFLQTDASINRGNSGGPLFNARGEVIGVNTAIFSPSGVNIGIGFAIPSKTAQSVTEQLIRSGRVERGYVGLRLQEVTDAIAKALGLPNTDGVLVASVERGGPAERAGIRTGDVVVGFNGQPIRGGRELSRAVASTRPGTQAQITVFRNGSTQSLTVAIGQRPEEQGARTGALTPPETGKRLGLGLSPLDEAARRQAGLDPGTAGVLVQRVEPNSPAAENGVQSGDIIVSANNREVSRPSEVADEWAKAREQNKPILLRIKRGDEYRFVAIPS